MKILHCIFAATAFMTLSIYAGDTIRPGLEPLSSQYYVSASEEAELINKLKEPFINGLDVQKPLQKWFDGRLLDTQGKNAEAITAWKQGLALFDDLKPLPKPVWQPIPEASLNLFLKLNLRTHPKVRVYLAEWKVDKLTQYGVVMTPADIKDDSRFPVILYCHGAAFGVPESFLPWLANLVEKGYVVIAPAMRGETLFQNNLAINGKAYKCEGEIENLEGEVNDCLSMLSGAWKLPYVRPNEFAMIGHSFGAGVGLLCCARAAAQAKALVSYDAWLVSPQRYYWDRMARSANNWLSWEDYCNRPVDVQLAGLMTRSIVHNAERLKCPMQFFIGGAYAGSVFHKSHDDLMGKLKAANIPYSYDIIPKGGHNFVLYPESAPARQALEIQTKFLQKVYPPAP